jgi:selenocysteine-specific elongation factor
MKKHTIVGTAGHIDHGKTAVIKALTGINADRLKEEKERGITIDIGFAYWKDSVTILDVPGHERFIRNMVAGVSTIDFFMLVIAADDGIMPQTIEHLDILNFFNIRDGIIVINKIDLVDDEWLSLVEEDVFNLLRKYKLDNLQIIKVSAITKENIDNLRLSIEKKISEQTEAESTQPFRLLVDRSFVIKGFGTVVTGTVLSGVLNKGETIDILPYHLQKKVRGLQAHGKESKSVSAGDRAAVNLQAISKVEITRGDVLTKINTLSHCNEFIGKLHTVSMIPVKINNRSKVRVYVGTAERFGQLIWYENVKFLKEESEYHVRVKLDMPLAAARNDAFLIRLHSPLITLAGGRVFEVNPPKIQHKEEDWKSYFDIMASNNYEQILYTIIAMRKLEAVSILLLQQKLFESELIISTAIENLIKQKKIRAVNLKGINHYVSSSSFDKLVNTIEEYLYDFHKNNPLLPGLNHQQLVDGAGYSWVQTEIFDAALNKLLNSNTIKIEQNHYSISGFSIRVSKDMNIVQSEILRLIKGTRFSPLTPEEISEKTELPLSEVRSILNILVKNKRLMAISREIFIEYTIWEEMLVFLRNFFQNQNEMPVAALKKFINTTRKYAIPIFEYLDSQGYTVRKGDVRKRGHNL